MTYNLGYEKLAEAIINQTNDTINDTPDDLTDALLFGTKTVNGQLSQDGVAAVVGVGVKSKIL